MRPIPKVTALLLWMFGCGGGNDEGGGVTLPDPVPEMAGTWSGTENVIYRGGAGCHSGIEVGLRSGDIFEVTQNGGQIVIEQLVNCVICRFTGTIAESGSFQAMGRLADATAQVTGQVTGKSMTATKIPLDQDCDKVAEYELTRP